MEQSHTILVPVYELDNSASNIPTVRNPDKRYGSQILPSDRFLFSKSHQGEISILHRING